MGQEVTPVALFGLFRRGSPYDLAAQKLYESAVTAARQPELYRDYGVPDTLDGRFELIVLHIFAILYRLKRDGGQARDLSQALFDTLFTDMDRSLREMGAGDLGVAPRVKRMTEGFNGRVHAYDRALEGSDSDLQDAIARNVYGTVRADEVLVGRMAAYLRRQIEGLSHQRVEDLASGTVEFASIAPTETSH
jgi:cytochrome b pre-mRNA-processing protein 3